MKVVRQVCLVYSLFRRVLTAILRKIREMSKNYLVCVRSGFMVGMTVFRSCLPYYFGPIIFGKQSRRLCNQAGAG